MTTVSDLRAESRAATRARLRDLALDAARDVALDRGWGAVRMGHVAAAIGTSRQTLHAEFGTKDDLGLALVMREVSVLFEGISERLAGHPGDLGGAVEDAVTFTLHETADNRLLQTALSGSAAGGDESLLPLLTTRSEPLLNGAVELFGDWVASQWPDLDADVSRIMVESVARLLISHAVLPIKTPEAAAQDLAHVACRCLGFTDPHTTHAQVAQ